MYKFISPEGRVVEARTIKEFAETYGFRESNVRSLACGYNATLKGWCSTNKKAATRRKRFMTELLNVKTGERSILGKAVTEFAKARGLCVNELYKLVNRRKLIYRNWVLASTWKATQLPDAAENK